MKIAGAKKGLFLYKYLKEPISALTRAHVGILLYTFLAYCRVFPPAFLLSYPTIPIFSFLFLINTHKAFPFFSSTTSNVFSLFPFTSPLTSHLFPSIVVDLLNHDSDTNALSRSQRAPTADVSLPVNSVASSSSTSHPSSPPLPTAPQPRRESPRHLPRAQRAPGVPCLCSTCHLSTRLFPRTAEGKIVLPHPSQQASSVPGVNVNVPPSDDSGAHLGSTSAAASSSSRSSGTTTAPASYPAVTDVNNTALGLPVLRASRRRGLSAARGSGSAGRQVPSMRDSESLATSTHYLRPAPGPESEEPSNRSAADTRHQRRNPGPLLTYIHDYPPSSSASTSNHQLSSSSHPSRGHTTRHRHPQRGATDSAQKEERTEMRDPTHNTQAQGQSTITPPPASMSPAQPPSGSPNNMRATTQIRFRQPVVGVAESSSSPTPMFQVKWDSERKRRQGYFAQEDGEEKSPFRHYNKEDCQ